jgi:hypothetical protein
VWYCSIGFRNCSDIVVFFYWIQELFRQCGIFLLDYRTIPHIRNSSWIQQKNTTLSEQFLNTIEQCHTVGTVPESNRKIPRGQLFRQRGIFLLDSGTVTTVWHCFIGFMNCSDSVVFFCWIQELFRQCGIVLWDSGTVPTLWYLNPIEKYHAVGTVLESNRTIPYCRNSS